MFNRSTPFTCSVVCILTLSLSLLPTLVQADEAETYRKLLSDKASSLVTVKFVLKISMGNMGDQENENEITGVMIAPEGVVICSNNQLGGFTSMMKKMMGPMGGGLSATPSDLKVIIGDELEGREAELVARDTELDLAWVRIKEPGDQPFDHVDLTKEVKPQVGQRIVALDRMGKYFARCPVVSEGRIGGITKSPRNLLAPNGPLSTAFGLPVFLPDGRCIGVTVMQLPEGEGNLSPMAMMGRLSSIQDMMAGMILPAADVMKATKRAMETVEKK